MNTLVKKFIPVVALVLASNGAFAEDSYLYWMVGPTVNNTLSDTAVVWDTARVSADGGSTYLTWYTGAGESSGSHSVGQLSSGGSADLYWGTFDSTAQTFLFELLQGSDVVGTKTETYAYLSTLGAIWTGSDTSPSGATAYTLTGVVPEPTSGLLMLFGLAGLALRRKRRA